MVAGASPAMTVPAPIIYNFNHPYIDTNHHFLIIYYTRYRIIDCSSLILGDFWQDANAMKLQINFYFK